MELIDHLAIGFSTALTPTNMLLCLVGCIVGTAIGVLPGIGAPATIALLLPTTYALEPVSAFIMLAGIFYGAAYGGSTTAILLNLPGESSSAVTAIDGYQMARQGRAGPALAIAAIGSFFAGTVSTFVVALLAPTLAKVALDFGAAEYCCLILLGLVLSVALAHGSVLKAIAMIVLGLLLGTIGTDIYSGLTRFTLGFPEMEDGLDIVAVAVGLFGLGEMIRSLSNETTRSALTRKVTGLMPTRKDLRDSFPAVLRGSFIGSLVGVLPGGGATLSSFMSYSVEKRLSKHPERFGHGAIEGVAGPESANNAGSQTSFIPMLTLGIPSNPVMALMIGALLIQGLTPGPQIATEQPQLFWGLIASMWIGNLMLVVLNLPLVGLWVRLLTIPYKILFPCIIAFTVIGSYTVNYNAFDLYALAFFGVLGFMLIRMECEMAPLLLGFVLGPMLEEYLRRAMLLSRGDPTVFVTRPLSAVLLGLAVAALVFVALPMISKKRDEVFVDE